MKKIFVTGGSGFIGSYVVDELIKRGYTVLNADIKRPVEELHLPYWKQVDLLEKDALVYALKEFSPTHLLHLAAKTDTDPDQTLEDYKANHIGTDNLLEAIKATPSIESVIITSSQFVNQYHGVPKHDRDYAPHTVYGESKVITEEHTRQAGLQCSWTIIRPTNIWGPRHPRYPKEFWFVLKSGRYFHPGMKPVIRSYGYVGNVSDQILAIFEADRAMVDKKVFYVGDLPVNLYDWANGFSLALNKRKVRVVPRFIVKMLAYTGDALRKLGIKFPITSSRYKSMTTGNSAPMEATLQAFGQPRYNLQQGIDETVAWLKSKDEFWNR